jgi:hypothetical protein
MGRPRGSKNRSTILREAHEAMVARGLFGHEQDFLDSLAVMEEGMRHFYTRAMAAKQAKQPDEVIDVAMVQAVQIAEKIAPYRHARLSAVKLAGDPNNPVRVHDNATIEELRELVKMHYDRLAPVLDLKSLMPPGDGNANRDVRQTGADNGTAADRSR